MCRLIQLGRSPSVNYPTGLIQAIIAIRSSVCHSQLQIVMPPRRKAAAKTTEAPAELAVVNGLMTPVSSTGSTRTTPKAMPATQKEDNLLTPAYTPERSIKQEDFADWQPKSEVIVEIPMRGASQMEVDSPFEEDVKPVIKSRAKKRSR
jgi:hypothetical protein